jgi:hypothetical protein
MVNGEPIMISRPELFFKNAMPLFSSYESKYSAEEESFYHKLKLVRVG